MGGQFGKGFITCRDDKARGWSAPAAIRVEGGSVGFQIGGSETDVVMLVMNHRGAERLMGDKFTLGAEGEVAAGPVGRDASAQTDAKLSAEMLSWSRSRGVFAGVSLKGTTLRPDREENEAMYGMPLSTKEVVKRKCSPDAGRPGTDFFFEYGSCGTALSETVKLTKRFKPARRPCAMHRPVYLRATGNRLFTATL